ncbi:hypothetical protein MMC27_006710 [Xylographa pallens]|nr:hypothetical protein [Xylographa pallens]
MRADKDRTVSIDGLDNLDEMSTLSASNNLAHSLTLPLGPLTIPDKNTVMGQKEMMQEKRLAALDRKAKEATREEAEKRERIRLRLEKLDRIHPGIQGISAVVMGDSATTQSTIHHDTQASSHKDSSSPALFHDVIRCDSKKDNGKQRSQHPQSKSLAVTQSMAPCDTIAQHLSPAAVRTSLGPTVMPRDVASMLNGRIPNVWNVQAAEQDSTTLSEAEIAEKTYLIDLARPDLLLTSILMSTYQKIQHRLLLILPTTHHPLSNAANELLIMCVFRAITGWWLVSGQLLPDAKAVAYFTEDWVWAQIFATAFLDKFEEVVCQREQLVSVGLQSISRKITAARMLVWPGWSNLEDKTKEFVEEHWGWDTVVALCAEGAG